MGDAKRRTLKALTDHLRRIHAEGQGVWQLSIFGPEAIPGLALGALDGDPYIGDVVEALANAVRQIETAPAKLPMLCLTCDNALTAAAMPVAFVLLHARRDDPSNAACNGICAECYERHPGEELQTAVTDAYRRQMISDLRVLPPISPPGRA